MQLNTDILTDLEARLLQKEMNREIDDLLNYKERPPTDHFFAYESIANRIAVRFGEPVTNRVAPYIATLIVDVNPDAVDEVLAAVSALGDQLDCIGMGDEAGDEDLLLEQLYNKLALLVGWSPSTAIQERAEEMV